jgi:sec-independent protein translocase protein TatB
LEAADHPEVPDRVLERFVLDLSLTKLLVLGVLALLIFGPDQLPKLAAQAGRALRDLRKIAENAKADLQDGLGPEFRDFDLGDLHPRTFVQKHLFDDPDGEDPADGGLPGGAAATVTLAPGESPPYDPEAT